VRWHQLAPPSKIPSLFAENDLFIPFCMKRFYLSILAMLFLCASLQAQSAPLSEERQIVHMLNRLGYGPRPGDIEAVKRIGIDHYIEQQLQPSSIPLPSALAQHLNNLAIERQSAGETLAGFLEARQEAKNGDPPEQQKRREAIRHIVEQTSQARLVRAVQSPRQLEEVMVDFWFNHFNVFIGKGLDTALVAGYERDAIRPYALGSFRDLLGATAKHPAMLFYLDNWLSTSADFHPGGLRQMFAKGPKAKANGLNENYARELMELHTLGVDGGYTQQDVTELARMLTGWTFAPQELARKNIAFRFDAKRHDNGSKTWLGRTIAPQGQREGEIALDILAMHPSTAHHISYELAQYFVRDDPPKALVDRMAKRYLETGGNIREVLHTLFFSPEFRTDSAVGAKFKTPYQFVVSAVRAADLPVNNVRPLLGTLKQLGMPLYGCQTPDGYKNVESAWLNPDALSRRIAFATALASGRLPLASAPEAEAANGMMPQQPMQAAEWAGRPAAAAVPVDAGGLLQTLGTEIGTSTRNAIVNRPPALQSAMILGSPDFMRR